MPPPTRKRPWSVPLADLVGPAIDPVLAKQGFGEADILLNWEDIVGERIAANSRPIKLQWPPRPQGQAGGGSQPATLVIRVEGGFGLELQHLSDQVLARVNAHLGWRCVGKLSFKQGPVDRNPPAAQRTSLSADALASATRRVADIEDDGLRSALGRLRAHVIK